MAKLTLIKAGQETPIPPVPELSREQRVLREWVLHLNHDDAIRVWTLLKLRGYESGFTPPQ